MIRDLAFAICLLLCLQVLTDAPRRDFAHAKDGSSSKEALRNYGAALAACDSLGLGGTDLCECLADPEACYQYDPELYAEVFGGSLETDAILEVMP